MSRPALSLSEQEQKELKEEYQRSRGNKDLDMCLRIQGLLLVNRGYRERDAAEMIGVGRRTLQEWIRRYKLRGIPALIKGPFKGAKCRLTDAQKAELSRIIEAGPQEVGLDSGVWTARIVAKVVKELFGVSYHPSHIGRILQGLGYSPKRARKKASKSDDELGKAWQLKRLPSIRKKLAKAFRSGL